MIEEESEDFDISSNYVTGETENFGSSAKTKSGYSKSNAKNVSPSEFQLKQSNFALTIKEIEQKERNSQNQYGDDEDSQGFQSEDKFGDLIKNIVKKSNNDNNDIGFQSVSERKKIKLDSPKFGIMEQDNGIQEGHQSVQVNDIDLESKFNTQDGNYKSIKQKLKNKIRFVSKMQIQKNGNKSDLDIDNVLPSMDNSFSDQFSSSQHVTNLKNEEKKSQKIDNFSKEKNIHNHFEENLNYQTPLLRTGHLDQMENFQSTNFTKKQEGLIDLRQFESDFSSKNFQKNQNQKNQNFNSNFDNGEVRIEDYQYGNDDDQKENFNNLKFTSEHDQNSLKFQSQNFENYDLTNYMEFASGKKRHINEHQDLINSLINGLREGGMAPEPSDEEFFSKGKIPFF